MKKCLFVLALLLTIGLCGCSSENDSPQVGGDIGNIEDIADGKEDSLDSIVTAEDISDSEPAKGAEADEAESSGKSLAAMNPTKANPAETNPTGANPEQRVSEYGIVGNLGLGFLVYTVPDKDDEDYRLYFFQPEEGEGADRLFINPSFNLSEASYIFPDVREGNVPIGKFKEIYLLETGDVQRDGICDLLAIAIYEKDGNEYYDTRVYEESEDGYVVNTALTQELNEKYHDAEDYPVWDIM